MSRIRELFSNGNCIDAEMVRAFITSLNIGSGSAVIRKYPDSSGER